MLLCLMAWTSGFNSIFMFHPICRQAHVFSQNIFCRMLGSLKLNGKLDWGPLSKQRSELHILTILALYSAWNCESPAFLSSLRSIFYCVINAATKKYCLSANGQLKGFMLKRNHIFSDIAEELYFTSCETWWPMFVCQTFCVWDHVCFPRLVINPDN